MNIFKWKKLIEEGIRLFQLSFLVLLQCVMDCVCMYGPIQGNGMWCATHACVWRMQLDSLNRVCTFVLSLKRLMWARHLWDRLSTLWELTLVHLVCTGCLWTLTCSFCMTDRPDVESLLHDSEMTRSWIFCTFWHWAEFTFAPLLFPSFTDVLSFFFLIHFALRTFFSNSFFWLLLSPCLHCFFHEEKRPHSLMYQQYFPYSK